MDRTFPLSGRTFQGADVKCGVVEEGSFKVHIRRDHKSYILSQDDARTNERCEDGYDSIELLARILGWNRTLATIRKDFFEDYD